MNRRELLRRLTGGLVAAGVPAVAIKDLDAPVDPKSTLVVLKASGRISADVRARITEEWRRAAAGTNWEGVRVVVLDEQLSMEVHQRA